METYLEAYHKRMLRNNDMLLSLAYNFADRGYIVYHTNTQTDRLISGLAIFHKNGNHLFFSFGEVPYRWVASISWKPSREHGSGKTVKEFYNINTVPDTDELIKLMQPYYLPTDNTEALDRHINYYRRLKPVEYQLSRKGEILFQGTQNACYYKLQRVQGQSADWAMKYEGYEIKELTTNKIA